MVPADPAPPSALLEPTLTRAAAAPLLSPSATFVSSFFGGPWAALAVGTVNLVRLRRARREAWAIALMALLGLAALAATAAGVARPDLLAGLLPEGFRPSTAVRRAHNVLGIAAWALVYLRLRPEYRAALLTGGFARPWSVAIPAVLGAMALHLLVGVVAAAAR